MTGFLILSYSSHTWSDDPPSKLPEPKGVGNGHLPKLKQLAMTEKEGPCELSFSPWSLSLEQLFGEDVGLQKFL